jgi:hypothetical protein
MLVMMKPRQGASCLDIGDVEVHNVPTVVGEHDEDEQNANPAVGTVKKSTETRSVTWLARNVRHV